MLYPALTARSVMQQAIEMVICRSILMATPLVTARAAMQTWAEGAWWTATATIKRDARLIVAFWVAISVSTPATIRVTR